MRTRNPSPRKLARWLAPAAVSAALLGCPNQELAPLSPCTVSGVSLEVPQSGVDKVDILFVIDNSGSMSEEQRKLSAVLADLIKPLTTGNSDGHQSAAGEDTDFTPVRSLHIGVVSSDMGVEGAAAELSCGEKSFAPADPNPTAPGAQRLIKPFGDDGIMQTSTDVAVAGIFAPPPGGGTSMEVVPGDASCRTVPASLPPGQRFISFTADQDDPITTAQNFGCIAKLGRNGCGLEQHLESMLKALTPPDNAQGIMFTAGSPLGQGTAVQMGDASGPNAGFLRDDAILAVIIVGDEDDCSVPDQFAPAMFAAEATTIPGAINTRCGLPDNQRFTHPVNDRYENGLRALKQQAYQDRIIVAAAVGMPLAPNTPTRNLVHGGGEIDEILGMPAMQPVVQQNSNGQDELRHACDSPTDGWAVPGIRQLNLVKAFGENGVATSICEDQYRDLITVITNKIASKLTGACLPRKLNADANGEVSCDVVEIQAANSNYGCDPALGREEMLEPRTIDGQLRNVCRMKQVPGGQGGEGWYYDDSSDEVLKQCKDNPQRIAFTGKANPFPGSQAKFECFQPVAAGVDANDKGRDAINLNCKPDPLDANAPSGDAVCAPRAAVNGQPLVCIQGACQMSCDRDSQCPEGWVCNSDANGTYCVNPTCPQTQQ